MPKYLLEVDYSAAGNAALVKDGGTARQKAVESMINGLGGKVESFYFTFGIRDAIVIADLPGNVAETTVDYKPPGA
jgi:uncharacterized protein with GYD domain